VLHQLVYYIRLYFLGGMVELWSLQARTHEGDGSLIVQLVLLSEHNKGRSIRTESVEKEVFSKVWVVKR